MKMSIIAASALTLLGSVFTANAQTPGIPRVDEVFPTFINEAFRESNPTDNNKIRAIAGTSTIGFIQNNTWFGYLGYVYGFNPIVATQPPIPYSVGIEVTVAKGNTTSAFIDVRKGSATGTLLTTIPVTSTGSFTTFRTLRGNFSTRQTGADGIFFVFRGGAGFLMDVRSFRLVSDRNNTRIEAESFSAESNPASTATISVASIPGGGMKVTNAKNNSWIRFSQYEFGGYSAAGGLGGKNINMRLAKGTNTIGAIDVRLDSPTGPIIGSLTNFVTGGNNTFVTFPRPFPQTVTGARDLYFVFTGQGTGNVVDVDWFEITE